MFPRCETFSPHSSVHALITESVSGVLYLLLGWESARPSTPFLPVVHRSFTFFLLVGTSPFCRCVRDESAFLPYAWISSVRLFELGVFGNKKILLSFLSPPIPSPAATFLSSKTKKQPPPHKTKKNRCLSFPRLALGKHELSSLSTCTRARTGH